MCNAKLRSIVTPPGNALSAAILSGLAFRCHKASLAFWCPKPPSSTSNNTPRCTCPMTCSNTIKSGRSRASLYPAVSTLIDTADADKDTNYWNHEHLPLSKVANASNNKLHKDAIRQVPADAENTFFQHVRDHPTLKNALLNGQEVTPVPADTPGAMLHITLYNVKISSGDATVGNFVSSVEVNPEFCPHLAFRCLRMATQWLLGGSLWRTSPIRNTQ